MLSDYIRRRNNGVISWVVIGVFDCIYGLRVWPLASLKYDCISFDERDKISVLVGSRSSRFSYIDSQGT